MTKELLKIEKRQSFVNGMMAGTVLSFIIIATILIIW